VCVCVFFYYYLIFGFGEGISQDHPHLVKMRRGDCVRVKHFKPFSAPRGECREYCGTYRDARAALLVRSPRSIDPNPPKASSFAPPYRATSLVYQDRDDCHRDQVRGCCGATGRRSALKLMDTAGGRNTLTA